MRRDRLPTAVLLGFPCGPAGKESACNAGGLGSIPGLGRSPGEGKGYPLQYSGLENSMDCIVYGVSESDTTEWFSLHFIHYLLLEQKRSGGGGLVTQSCPTLAAPWTVSHQAHLSMGFPRQEYWSRLPFPSPDLPNPGIEPSSPTLQADSLSTEPPGKQVYFVFIFSSFSFVLCVTFT